MIKVKLMINYGRCGGIECCYCCCYYCFSCCCCCYCIDNYGNDNRDDNVNYRSYDEDAWERIYDNYHSHVVCMAMKLNDDDENNNVDE